MISSQIFAKDLPSIPALSNAETATHVFFFDLTILGKINLNLATPAVKPVEIVFL